MPLLLSYTVCSSALRGVVRVDPNASSARIADEKPLSGRMTIACASLQEDPRSKDLASIDYPETFLGAGGDESCLACRSRIEFSDARRARCTKGHEWGSCFFYSLVDILEQGLTERIVVTLDRTVLDHSECGCDSESADLHQL